MDKRQVVFRKVKEMIIQELGAKPELVKMEASLAADFGADSLDALELFNQLESEFLITISDEDATKIKKVSELVDYVLDKVNDNYFE